MPLVKEKLETKEIIKDMRKNVSVQVDSDFALLLPSGVYEIKKMEPRSKIRTIIVFCLFLAIAGIIGFGYFCQDQVIFPYCMIYNRNTSTTLVIYVGCKYIVIYFHLVSSY
ncbi:uncharacterized protein LOC111683356 isoform X1 [Lucilia cuprina]|uniref:uncharacterized protein LOC111683356 isoform X1 n=2 Tax=Lucilia cuprina TaxID=7375 RepID=UPI001F06A687|nr:uncharacterized protein LOC111683356 isoform X1 [Lucilia cuprina]